MSPKDRWKLEWVLGLPLLLLGLVAVLFAAGEPSELPGILVLYLGCGALLVRLASRSLASEPLEVPFEEDLPPLPSSSSRSALEEEGTKTSLLRSVLDGMGEGVLVLDPQGKITLLNPAAESILGITAAAARGRHYLEVLRNAELSDLLDGASQDRSARRGEVEWRGADVRIFDVSVSPVTSTQGEFLGLAVVWSDVTGLKRLARQRVEFAANVSHELKTPLSAVLGYCETLLEADPGDAERRRAFLEKLHAQARRLHALIQDVLELSRIESGGWEERVSDVNLGEVARRVAELIRLKAETRKVRVETAVPGEASVRALPEGLFQVLVNLTDNAVKYCREGGRVLVDAVPEGERWRLRVSDEGPGIPAEHLPRLFERFYRVDASRSRENGGTGLGLAIVKHLVERMRGEVGVESEVGKGSTFSVLLPSADRG